MLERLTKQDVDRYCRRVKKHLPFSLRKRFLNALRSDLEDYLEQDPGATLDTIYDKFGKPEQFATEYLNSLDKTERTKAKRMHRLAILAMILAIAIGLFFSSVAIYIAIDSRPQSTYHEYEITYD